MMWPGMAVPGAEPGPETEKDLATKVACSRCCCPSTVPGCTAVPVVGEEGASVMPGTEIKYTEPVGSVPP